MPANPLTKVLYTAEATVQGGRAGHGRTADGRLDLQLSVPEDMGGPGGTGTNPEQLFAIGYGACFQSSLLAVAQGRKLDAGAATSRSLSASTGHPCRGPRPETGEGRGRPPVIRPLAPWARAVFGHRSGRA